MERRRVVLEAARIGMAADPMVVRSCSMLSSEANSNYLSRIFICHLNQPFSFSPIEVHQMHRKIQLMKRATGDQMYWKLWKLLAVDIVWQRQEPGWMSVFGLRTLSKYPIGHLILE
jgi:hypothetical protein